MNVPAPPAPSRGRPFAHLQGVWRSHAYGQLLEIGSDSYRLYEETAVSCLFILEGTLEELRSFYVDVRVSPRRQSFSARRSTGVTRVRFRRLAAMPANCPRDESTRLRDPVYNFQVFWQTFAERYALFELRGVDWQATGDHFRSQINPTTRHSELFACLVDMIAPLRDGHVRLHAPFRRFEGGDLSVLESRVLSPQDRADDVAPATVIAELREQQRTTIRRLYLRDQSKRSGNGTLEWGTLDDRTGYLAIRAMAGQCGRLHHPREDQESAARAMERILSDIGERERMVIDLRENGGGYDGVALRLAGYFIDRKRLAFTKAPAKHSGFAPIQRIHVEPRGRSHYHGSIVVLTSCLTASAAEIFVLALLQHPRATRIGEATQGILSDVMERHLPNGWTINLSNELYSAYDGALYEDRGIPADIHVPFLQRRVIEAGRDAMLDRVLADG